MDITELASELKLPYIRVNAQMLIDEANHTKMGYEEFLENFLEHEVRLRRENGVANRMRYAKFPLKKYLEDFDTNKYVTEFKGKFEELRTLNFIKNKENIILIGSPGSGKTHYATGLGIKACMEGMTVLFISVPNLIIEIKEAMNQNQLSTYKRKFEKYDLVILDELGYVSFDKVGCEILFNLLSNRNDKGSIIITNLTFDRWEEIFKDAMLTGAMVDRLAHKAHIMDISRETSHRYEETISWLQNKK
ncbi:MAG TPA: ATP-binding protein [Clostridiales bacterium]|nr:MAG: ATP-binding protein [Clostridiales bacterium GWD2_32_19]HCC06586.1 ATP-binding protein [Clostridiales bacterium]